MASVDYEHLRSQMNAIHTALYPVLPRRLMQQAANALGMLRADGQIVYSSPHQVAVCSDFATYGLISGRRLLARRLEAALHLDPMLCEQMPLANYRIFSIQPLVGHPLRARALDLRSGSRFIVLDPQMASPDRAGSVVASHMVELDAVWMTTGVPLGLDAAARTIATEQPLDVHDGDLAAAVIRAQWRIFP